MRQIIQPLNSIIELQKVKRKRARHERWSGRDEWSKNDRSGCSRSQAHSYNEASTRGGAGVGLAVACQPPEHLVTSASTADCADAFLDTSRVPAVVNYIPGTRSTRGAPRKWRLPPPSRAQPSSRTAPTESIRDTLGACVERAEGRSETESDQTRQLEERVSGQTTAVCPTAVTRRGPLYGHCSGISSV